MAAFPSQEVTLQFQSSPRLIPGIRLAYDSSYHTSSDVMLSVRSQNKISESASDSTANLQFNCSVIQTVDELNSWHPSVFHCLFEIDEIVQQAVNLSSGVGAGLINLIQESQVVESLELYFESHRQHDRNLEQLIYMFLGAVVGDDYSPQAVAATTEIAAMCKKPLLSSVLLSYIQKIKGERVGEISFFEDIDLYFEQGGSKLNEIWKRFKVYDTNQLMHTDNSAHAGELTKDLLQMVKYKQFGLALLKMDDIAIERVHSQAAIFGGMV